MKMYGLPKYIHVDGGRAFLVLCADITGRWNAGYTAWYGENSYRILGPVGQDAATPEEALRLLAEARERSKK